jgi:hypothetical protein
MLRLYPKNLRKPEYTVIQVTLFLQKYIIAMVHICADKSLAFRICSTTKTIFLGWVKEVRTTKS